MIANKNLKHRLTLGTCLLMLLLILVLPLALVQGQQEGPKKADGKPREAQAQRKGGDREQPGIRGTITKLDLKKGTITVVRRSDGGTKVYNWSIADKNIRVTGVVRKVSDLRVRLQVVVQVSEDDNIISISTSPARRRRGSRVERVFAAYDKDANNKVDFKEWLAMKEGKFNAARTALEKKRFDAVDKNRDGSLSLEEFRIWRNPNRREIREGNGKRGPRDGEAKGKKGPREG